MATAHVTFADQYKAAGISPTAELIKVRKPVFDKLRGGLDNGRILDLVRLYFGLTLPENARWFKDPFASADPSFTLIDNAREAAILAYILLSAALEDGKVLAGLAPLTAAAGNARAPSVYPTFLVEAREKLAIKAIELRRLDVLTGTKISVPQSKEPPALESDWNKTAEALKAVNDNAATALANLGKQVQTALVRLSLELTDLREETEMLWWYVGGWSRTYEKPLADFGTPVMPVLAGLDLGRLVRTTLGPVSVSAILYKLLHSSAKTLPVNITIQEAVDALSQEDLSKLQITDVLNKCADLCPVLSAFAKAEEIGPSPSWYTAYQRVVQIDEKTSFKPVDLAVQVFRETLLLKTLS